MAHFALLDSSGIVQDVIKVDNADAPDPAPDNSEALGRSFLASLGLTGNYVQTSYNGTFRGRYAGIGYRYDPEADVFIAPQPYPSWVLDATYSWNPPTPRPQSGGPWEWDDNTLSWIELPPS